LRLCITCGGVEALADILRLAAQPPNAADMALWGQGLADIARHVIDTQFEPSFLEFTGILWRGEQYLLGPSALSVKRTTCSISYYL